MASSSAETDYPMENDWEYLHGRINPGIEENLHLVESLDVKDPDTEILKHRNNLLADEEDGATDATSAASISTGIVAHIFLLSLLPGNL